MDREWLFLILGILIPIVYDISKPWVKSYWEKGSLSIRERRLYLIVKRYRRIKYRKDNPSYFYHITLLTFARGFTLTLPFLILAAISPFVSLNLTLLSQAELKPSFTRTELLFFYGATYAVGVYVFILFTELVSDIRDVIWFEQYEEKAVARYKRLGGKMEDFPNVG